MPRPNPPRSLQSEENLAHRVAYEREQRGWTYEDTAKHLTDAGCPIQGSAIYKIEKGNPRRRISVDELVALSKVFDVDIANLLVPVQVITNAQARDALYAVIDAAEGFRAAVESNASILEPLFGSFTMKNVHEIMRAVTPAHVLYEMINTATCTLALKESSL